MEYVVLGAFSLLLFLCLALDVSIVLALLGGLLIFALYGVKKGFSVREVAGFSLEGVRTVKNILITFLLIGVMTALWRGAGTIPVIVCWAVRLISPPVFLLMTFLLNCLISVLTGTAFGTSATMGVICATMGASLGVPPFLTGGAVLSGAYFGDRCSPVSTSALLVATLTKTDIFSNLRRMIRTAAVPFLVSCGIYTAVGALNRGAGEIPDLSAVFAVEFRLSWIAVLPAVVLLLLAVLRVNVKLAMTASICAAIPVCLLTQSVSAAELPSLMVLGYAAKDPQIAAMLNGGGVLSMAKVVAIVCISSAYSGIFRKTGLLEGVKTGIHRLACRTTPYFAAAVTAVVTGMIACNQTLMIMLTDQLCRDTEPDAARFAITLEDSAVVIAPLIPWSIACEVSLTAVGAPGHAVLLACFLYLLPVWRCITAAAEKKTAPAKAKG